ncbi:hypothetical protein BHE74_00047763 [Ensete ventricosum]|nr:hypothetical protein BHE74_00047763 [Ensete ventricosum]
MRPDGDCTISDAARPQVCLPVYDMSLVCVRGRGPKNWSSDPVLPHRLALGHVVRSGRRTTIIPIKSQYKLHPWTLQTQKESPASDSSPMGDESRKRSVSPREEKESPDDDSSPAGDKSYERPAIDGRRGGLHVKRAVRIPINWRTDMYRPVWAIPISIANLG